MKRLMGIALACGLALACSKDKESQPAGSKPTATATAGKPTDVKPAEAKPASGDGVGVPECDAYLDKYSKCVGKQAPEAQGPMRESLETMKKAWREAAGTPDGKQGLAQACAAASDAAKQAMTALGCEW